MCPLLKFRDLAHGRVMYVLQFWSVKYDAQVINVSIYYINFIKLFIIFAT